MMHFDFLAGSGVTTRIFNNGERLRVDIADVDLTDAGITNRLGRTRHLQIAGSQQDMRRLYYALGFALDEAEKLAPPRPIINPIHPHIDPPHLINQTECPCSFGAGQADSACVACSGGHDYNRDRREP